MHYSRSKLIKTELQIFVCHFRTESPTEDSMDTNEYLFTMENHYRDPAGTTFHAKTVLLCCVDHWFLCLWFESCCSGSWEWTLKDWRCLSQWEKFYFELAFNIQYCFGQKDRCQNHLKAPNSHTVRMFAVSKIEMPY